MNRSAHDIQMALARLRRADPEFRRFAVKSHRYHLNPPLTDEELSACEARLGITLPKEYREFVTKVGDGGAGPGYGLLSLRIDMATERSRGKKSRQRGGEPPDPARPFGRPANVQEAGRLGGFPTHGVIPLAETGCGGAYCLVMAGLERGTVWGFDGFSYYPAYLHDPVYPAGATVADRQRINNEYHHGLLSPANKLRLNFWDWYLHWLESSLVEAEA